MKKTRFIILSILCMFILTGCKKNKESDKCNHIESEWIIDKETSCESEGSKHKECTICHEILQEEKIEKTAHSLIHHEGKEPTCVIFGYKPWDTCSNCSYTTYEKIKATGHTISDWIIDFNSTCTKEGKKYKECTVCKTVIMSQIIEKINHNYVDKVCSECGKKKNSDGLAYYLAYDYGKYQIYGIGDCTDTDIVIPDNYNNLLVISILESAFSGCTSLESITIPSSVSWIGSEAFYNCTSLESVYYDGTIENWCNISFSNAYSNPMCYAKHFYMLDNNNEYKEVTEIEIPDTITLIGNYQFYGFNNITKITIPSSVTSIGECAFKNCTSLEQITFEKNSQLESIGYRALANCTSLKSIEIPSSVTSIGDEAFSNCPSIESILVDDNNKYYKSIDGNLYTKDGKTLIQYAIGKKETSFVIPSNVTSIGEYAFSSCPNLKSIVIPSSVTSIGKSAFFSCSSLESITLPFIGGTMDTKRYLGHIFGASSFADNSSYVPESLKEVIILEGCTSIGSSAFFGCTSLESIIIPSTVTSIGKDAFSGCTYLESIIIPSSVTSIGFGAFSNCTSLESITLPFIGGSKDSNKYLGYIFGSSSAVDCSQYVLPCLKEVILLEGCTSIGDESFMNCSSLERIIIPSSITSIGFGAFSNCTSLESITLPFIGGSKYSNTYLGYIFGALSYIDSSKYVPDNLKKITLLRCCLNIENAAFYNCINLESIIIPSSVTNIGESAFYNCTNLTIYCEESEKQSGWDNRWNYSNCPVVWNYNIN